LQKAEAIFPQKDQLSWKFRIDTIAPCIKVIRIDVAHCGYFFCAIVGPVLNVTELNHWKELNALYYWIHGTDRDRS
jgi:hypothetical protein